MRTCTAPLPKFHTIGLLLLAAMPSTAYAAPGDSIQVTGSVEVTVVASIEFAPIEDLRFGTIARPATAGTVTVDEDGTVTSTFDISQFPGGRGPATFLVRGDPRRFVEVTLPTSSTITNGTSTMTVDQFNANTFSVFQRLRLDNNGEFILNVGGRLNVSATQEAGIYTGTFNVTVTYQ